MKMAMNELTSAKRRSTLNLLNNPNLNLTSVWSNIQALNIVIEY